MENFINFMFFFYLVAAILNVILITFVKYPIMTETRYSHRVFGLLMSIFIFVWAGILLGYIGAD